MPVKSSASPIEASSQPAQQIIFAKVVTYGLILGLLLLALAIRLYKITSVPLSLDEIITIARYAPLSVIDIFKTHYSNNHPLASLLAHLFSPQADHLFMMRWPLVLIGMLSLPFVYRLSADLFGRKVGLLALLLVSVSPVHIGYSVIIRGYIGLISLTVISLYFLWRVLQKNRWRDWLGFVVTNILIIYFHLFGVVAAGSQVGLVILWLFQWLSNDEQSYLPVTMWRIKSLWLKFGLVTLLLIIVYPLLIYSQTSSILLTERWPSDFEVWGDGVFSWSQDMWPFAMFVRLMGPISAKGVGTYIYLFFCLVGLVLLWQRQKMFVLTVVIWFLAPFIVIFAAVQIVGQAFYAYVRFLLYLLPVYLILVAVGFNACLNWLSTLAIGRDGRWSVVVRVVSGIVIVGLLALIAISVNWYILRSTHADWPGVAGAISRGLQPSDIAICEEHQRGFAEPDRAKPYCTWMLDFFLPELEGYTPHFQSSTDFIANYEHLQGQRAAMLQPGGVWLVIWQKIIFHPGELITNQKPPVEPPPPLSVFKPYQVDHFGSATLLHIDSEDTLLGNVYKTLELLLRVEQSPADKARYYRSLAELEAVQGHTLQASEFFEKSRGMVEQAGGDPVSFLKDTKQVIDRIPDGRLPPGHATQVNYRFGQSLCLRAYEISSANLKAGHPLVLTLYWQALAFINEDYTFFLDLNNERRQIQGRLEFQPFDRVYPTPWWWPGQQIVEQREFLIPADLAGQDYEVRLGVYDNQSSANEIVKPLFLMLSEADGLQPTGWKFEPIAPPAAGCSQR